MEDGKYLYTCINCNSLSEDVCGDCEHCVKCDCSPNCPSNKGYNTEHKNDEDSSFDTCSCCNSPSQYICGECDCCVECGCAINCPALDEENDNDKEFYDDEEYYEDEERESWLGIDPLNER